MKAIFGICILLLSLLIITCHTDETSPEYLYEAEVVGLNSDCGLFAVKILKGLPSVKSIIGSTLGDSIYIAKNLPTDFEVTGLRIMLDIRKPLINELSPCTYLGPSYNWLFVKKAIKK
jgi:hypothetical protein